MLAGRDVTDTASWSRPAVPVAIRQCKSDDDNHTVDSQADEPKTRVGLAAPPKSAPTTERTTDADEGTFATQTPEIVASFTGKLKFEEATL